MSQRYIPNNMQEIKHDELACVIYLGENKNKPVAIGYTGKRSKPDFNFRFHNEMQREQYLNKYLEDRKKSVAEKQERKSKRLKFVHSLKEGDILACSWGYEQTNVDFFQVVKLIGKTQVVVREIESQGLPTDHGHDYGKIIGLKDQFKGEEMTKRVSGDYTGKNCIRISDYSHAYDWDGQPKYYSWGY